MFLICLSGMMLSGQFVNFTSSSLPVFIINTNNQQIPDEPKIAAHLGIIYNGPGQINSIFQSPNYYDGYIGIELRGNSTQHYPKKPYAIETRDSLGENLNVSLFGMPAENDWVLRASYFDHTFIRNPLANHMSRITGRWASRCHLVELVVNGEYVGIYILMEKIKRDKGRLDIAKLNPDEIAAPDITGGYIYEVTGFEDNLGESRYLRYPDYDEAAPEQRAYIQQYDNAFRSVMKSSYYTDKVFGYSTYIDVESFVDELIVQEAMRNSDAYGWSGYFHKDREGKINAGPVWDFDQSAGNSSYPDDGVITGWMFEHPKTNNTPFFWPLLFKDPLFSYRVRQRWEELRKEAYKTSNLLAYIDSIANMLSEAQAREFEKWPVLGKYIWRETSGYERRITFQLEVDYLKNFLIQRWSWMDLQLARIENPTAITANSVPLFEDIVVYPNPASDFLQFDINISSPSVISVYIYNNLGVLVMHSSSYHLSQGKNEIVLQLDELEQPGSYYYRIFIDGETGYTGRFVKL
ncbi:MAG TPA: CotH kinase family protein [Bacteroidales bacterium]|nr:CotH kinase family protein [Bacteroidales bacterium]